MAIKDGGPAFPQTETEPREASFGQVGDSLYGDTYSTGGMSLRDYFAGQALAGLLARGTGDGNFIINGQSLGACTATYVIADAMLVEREKAKP
jgi:hypothetical protein